MRRLKRISHRCPPNPLPVARLFIVTGSVAALLLMSSCKKHPTPDETTAPSASGSRDPNLSVTAGGYHGNHFSGPIYIPRASPMEDGTTAYEVTYQDGVTVISNCNRHDTWVKTLVV